MNLEEEIKEIADAKRYRRLARARTMTNQERFKEGLDLYVEVLERMKSGIRYRHPEFTEQQVVEKLNENMNKLRKSERVTNQSDLSA